MAKLEYPVIIEPLSVEDGGGYAALVPDLPGCLSGDTPEDALASVSEAMSWIEEATPMGRRIPTPSRHLQAAE